eukprot:Nitzschia sp. Nitz4//scaffold267_size26297//13979//15263//NITZ4_008268-RA/size26297-processed-gene-0.0-mRNA-1//1//CDS//3329544902//1071//frame0
MGYTVGIIGASGAVGQELLKVLEQRTTDGSFPAVDQLRLFGSSRSAGRTVPSKVFGSSDSEGNLTVELFSVASARECDIIFLAVSGSFALEHAKNISEGDGPVVIDNSSAFRYDADIPLVIPEINADASKGAKLIANPNCTTAIGAMAIAPIVKEFGIKKLLMSTYQAASGAGQPGMDELLKGTKDHFEALESGNGASYTPKNEVFAHPLPFNVIPHIDKFQENGYTKEEMKVTWETRKICGLSDDVAISCSAVRIPTLRAHSEVIVLETTSKVDVAKAKALVDAAPGVQLVDDPESNLYPMPLTATGKYDVEAGRFRQSLAFGEYGVEFFVSGDQLLRGAALNAVLIAEALHTNGTI